MGRHCFSPSFRGVQSPQDRSSDVVLSARVLDGPNLLRRILPSPRRTYLMLELSWRLCMFIWYICYVRRQWDGFQHSSTYCQVCVGVCGRVLSCQSLNVAASRGPGSNGAQPVLKAPCAQLPVAHVCPEPRRWCGLGSQVVKSYPPMPTEIRESTSADCSRV
jgi:hypothetical protein